ncbi:hypothetical protein OU995_11970 [Roseateles sp. SL47]|uniref:hypothetical protein n=1 Tax=Roseateles sp. SL47 TaxID=2995138 RepID=UPI002271E67A|nr:hypothetical protein [Roseateles sp. SL47]WAC75366.1 hypothetical protein OU995_11970 [Roseateles sp. SL47]
MAAIASIDTRSQLGAFAATPVVMTASDTITFNSTAKQLLVLRNGTAGALTPKIDGDGGTTVNVQGLGVVDVSAGYTLSLAVGETKAVILSTIAHYCKGVVTITGATGVSAQLFDL